MDRLIPTVLSLVNDRKGAKKKTIKAKKFVEKKQKESMKILENSL
jgi:hypothetical protein